MSQSTPQTDTKTCQKCQKPFRLVAQEKEFYQKKDLPEPNDCPECRLKARLSLRNERKLYKRTCNSCQKEIISTYAPDSPYIVYCQECYWKQIG